MSTPEPPNPPAEPVIPASSLVEKAEALPVTPPPTPEVLPPPTAPVPTPEVATKPIVPIQPEVPKPNTAKERLKDATGTNEWVAILMGIVILPLIDAAIRVGQSWYLTGTADPSDIVQCILFSIMPAFSMILRKMYAKEAENLKKQLDEERELRRKEQMDVMKREYEAQVQAMRDKNNMEIEKVKMKAELDQLKAERASVN